MKNSLEEGAEEAAAGDEACTDLCRRRGQDGGFVQPQSFLCSVKKDDERGGGFENKAEHADQGAHCLPGIPVECIAASVEGRVLPCCRS